MCYFLAGECGGGLLFAPLLGLLTIGLLIRSHSLVLLGFTATEPVAIEGTGAWPVDEEGAPCVLETAEPETEEEA